MSDSDGTFQECFALGRQLERSREQDDRLAVWPGSSSALEGPNRLNAELCPFGELLLRHPCVEAKLPK
jgi:hypothetical protein